MTITATTKSRDSDLQAQADLQENLIGLCYLDWIKNEERKGVKCDNTHDQD